MTQRQKKMDETDISTNRGDDDAELSKSSDEHSFIGKMKVGVSRILPNSLSKWLSPKVDVTNARRRRHEEMDSDEDAGAVVRGSNRSPAASAIDSRYQSTPQYGAPPPNKKKKTFSEIMSRNTVDLYSPAATPLIGERSNIVSSTLIEDVPHSRKNNQFNRYTPVENGQNATATADDTTRENDRYNNDEASSSQSREKPINPFIINNDSSVVNFSAHLQRAKSLFTNRSYVSPRLKNYRMRNPRSSLYRSTSSLCDNNSVSSNASSAMSSPFYNGQTTYGGASATSRRMSSAAVDFQMHHRPKVPTNLVTSRSTSSLNNIGGTSASASMSTTAKRILDVMSKYNTPLTEVRRISNALPSIAETSALNKRRSILELDTTTNEADKSKRSLLKPNTPYNRPFGRNPIESVFTSELHVPSMPELLQLKKFATNTMKIRDLANQSDNILNRPVSSVCADFKFTTSSKSESTEQRPTADLDASNNNKVVNNKNDAISMSTSANDMHKEHRNKIRNNLTKRNLGRRADEDAMPEPVNLPNVSLVLDKKAELKLPEPLKLPMNTVDQRTGSNKTVSETSAQVPFKFKNTNVLIAPTTKDTKRTNGNTMGLSKTFEISPTKPNSSVPATANLFNSRTSGDFIDKFPATLNNGRTTLLYRFSEPIIINASSKPFEQFKNFSSSEMNYKFSEPIYVTEDKSSEMKTKAIAAPTTFSNFQFDANPIKGFSSDSGIETTQSFGSNASKSTVKPTLTTSAASEFSTGKSISSVSTKLKEDDQFKSLVAKQKKGKWECSDCMAQNEIKNEKCVCCGCVKEKGASSKSSQGQSAVVVSDDIMKSIAAKQKQSKWECKDCMTQNDQTQSKCPCCGGANPNASLINITENKPVVPKPTFSFGTLPALSSADVSKPIANSTLSKIDDKQRDSIWKCSACLSTNNMSKSKCACCEQSRDVTKGATTSGTVPAISQFSFGSNPSKTAFAPAKSGFSFGSNADTIVSASSTFSFGNLNAAKTDPSPLDNKKSDESTDNVKTDVKNVKDPVQKLSTTAAAPSTQFSFGNPTILPSTSKIEATQKSDPAPVATDNIFKSIVDKEKSSSWECSSCMTKNSNDVTKCACCEAAKDGSSTSKDSTSKNDLLVSNQKFVFGTPSSTISIGSMASNSKTENKPSFQFGASSSNTSSGTTTTTSSSTTEEAPSSTSNLFGIGSSQASTFSFKPSTTTTVSTASSQSVALGGFKFAFGSSPSTTVPTFGTKEAVSKDEIDTGVSSNKGITVLENVLVKPATNGPIESAPKQSMFVFSQSLANQTTSTETDDQKAKKRPNTDLADTDVLNKFPASSTPSNSTPFIFEQPANTSRSNTFSTIALNPSQESTQKNSTFSFGTSATKPSPNAFPTVQPSFSSSTPTFSFNTGSTSSTPTTTAAAPPIFGSNTFPVPTPTVFGSNLFSPPSSTQLTLGGFKASSTFGSPATASTTSSQNATAQPQASPSPDVFQFGASNNNQNASFSSEPAKMGGFNFSLTTTPTFNFSEQSTQQSNIPFQFGAAETTNIFSAQPSANATAISQRRKIRPVRRVNRP